MNDYLKGIGLFLVVIISVLSLKQLIDQGILPPPGQSKPAAAAVQNTIPLSGGDSTGVGAAQVANEGQTLFQEKCVACHTVGGGKLVGPDLKGVTTRRDRAWLLRWVKEPDKMLATGDPTATQLLQEFNNVPMPNLGLTEKQVEALIAYLQPAETTTATAPTALPALYIPTLVAAVIVLLALTAVGLGIGKKQVEVRL